MSETCRIITGVALILKKDDNILLLQRNIPGKIAHGMFALPGGMVEHGETIKQTACREAAEELGVSFAKEDVSLVHMLRLREKYNEETKQTTQILMLYFAQVTRWEGEPQNLEPHKHSGLAWFEMHKLPATLFPLNAHALADIQQGIPYGEYGWE